MPHTLYEFLPLVALALFLIVTAALALRTGTRQRAAWLVPAVLSAAFLGWSLFTQASEWPTGFWAEHTRNAWGNQIWFDLLLAFGTAWALLLPRARATGMRVWPWLALIICTGSIGLLAMFARCLFLESRQIPS